jgi:alanine racemase
MNSLIKIEISKKALAHNVRTIRKLVGPKVVFSRWSARRCLKPAQIG